MYILLTPKVKGVKEVIFITADLYLDDLLYSCKNHQGIIQHNFFK